MSSTTEKPTVIRIDSGGDLTIQEADRQVGPWVPTADPDGGAVTMHYGGRDKTPPRVNRRVRLASVLAMLLTRTGVHHERATELAWSAVDEILRHAADDTDAAEWRIRLPKL